MNRKQWGEALALLREKKNLERTQLGARTGVAADTVEKWERGTAFPTITQFDALTKALDVADQDMLSYALAVYAGAIKTRNRLIAIGVLAAIVGVLFGLGDPGTLIVFELPIYVFLGGIGLICAGLQRRRTKGKAVGLFVLGGCCCGYPLLNGLFFLYAAFAMGGLAPN